MDLCSHNEDPAADDSYETYGYAEIEKVIGKALRKGPRGKSIRRKLKKLENIRLYNVNRREINIGKPKRGKCS